MERLNIFQISFLSGMLFLLAYATTSVVGDYLCLWETRLILRVMPRFPRLSVALVVSDICLTIMLALTFNALAFVIWAGLFEGSADLGAFGPLFRAYWGSFIIFPWGGMPARELGFLPSIPAIITSVWIWFYAGSGLVIKLAHRLKIGLHWFNAHMDIEKHPLQSIGLVSGCIVAVAYWTVALAHRIL